MDEIRTIARPPRLRRPTPPADQLPLVEVYTVECALCHKTFTTSDATHTLCGPCDFDRDDELFQLHPHTCADCGTSFATSARHATRCALCASLRSGEVGPATVQCPGCDVTHQVPVLAKHKFCPTCAADLGLTKIDLLGALQRAQAAAAETTERMIADYAHADEQDQQRFDIATTLRHHGLFKNEQRTPEQARANWQAWLARGDALSQLLARYDAWDAARLALEHARAAVEEAME